jgi:hypothetical protein
MKDHSENTLRAAIKCLRDTVAPAVDPTDPQAQEQLRLTIDFLEFLRTRLYDVHARHRYELGHQITVAGSVLDDAELVSSRAAGAVRDALAEARTVHGAPDAHTRDLQTASERVWGAVRGLLREAREASDDVRERISENVVGGLAPLIEMESAWYAPFGFEPDPASVPDLAGLLPTRAVAGP